MLALSRMLGLPVEDVVPALGRQEREELGESDQSVSVEGVVCLPDFEPFNGLSLERYALLSFMLHWSEGLWGCGLVHRP